MKRYNSKALLAGAALAGLLSGGAVAQAATVSTQGGQQSIPSASGAPGVLADKKDMDPDHSCAGKNSCKGKGGCKTGDNGCAGKNSCKGKGGCAIKDGKPAHDKK